MANPTINYKSLLNETDISEISSGQIENLYTDNISELTPLAGVNIEDINITDTVINGLTEINLISASTDNKISRYNGTRELQGTGITIDDSDNITNATSYNGLAISETGGTTAIIPATTNDSLILRANGTGIIQLNDACNFLADITAQTQILTDTITEKTSAHGVDIESINITNDVLANATYITTTYINPISPATQIIINGMLDVNSYGAVVNLLADTFYIGSSQCLIKSKNGSNYNITITPDGTGILSITSDTTISGTLNINNISAPTALSLQAPDASTIKFGFGGLDYAIWTQSTNTLLIYSDLKIPTILYTDQIQPYVLANGVTVYGALITSDTLSITYLSSLTVKADNITAKTPNGNLLLAVNGTGHISCNGDYYCNVYYPYSGSLTTINTYLCVDTSSVYCVSGTTFSANTITSTTTNNNLYLSGKGTGYVEITDKLDISGSVSGVSLVCATGTASFGGRIASDLSPSITTTYNLGASSYIWHDAYIENILLSSYIKGSNGTGLIQVNANTSAVNYMYISNATTGNAPLLQSTGSDTNISLQLATKGTGSVVLMTGSTTKMTVSTGTVYTTATPIEALTDASSKTFHDASNATSWIAISAGQAGYNKVVMGYLSGNSHIGSHNTAFSAWTNLYVAWRVDTSPSDRKLKKNIKDSDTNAIDTINKIKIRSFDWGDGANVAVERKNKHQNLGLIAQEIEEIPELTEYVGEIQSFGETVKTVLYSFGDPTYLLLLKAIQEQQTMINDLKQQIDILASQQLKLFAKEK